MVPKGEKYSNICLLNKSLLSLHRQKRSLTVEPETKRMELQEGLDFYRICLEHTKLSIQEVMKDKSIPEWRKGPLIDKLLDRMIEFQKNIDMIEELLR